MNKVKGAPNSKHGQNSSKEFSASPYLILLSAAAITSNIKGLLPFFGVNELIEQIAVVIFFIAVPVISVQKVFSILKEKTKGSRNVRAWQITLLVIVTVAGTCMLTYHGAKLAGYLWLNEQKTRMALAKSFSAAQKLKYNQTASYFEQAKQLAKNTTGKNAMACVGLMDCEIKQQRNLLDITSNEFKEYEKTVRELKNPNLLTWLLLLKSDALSRNGKGEEAWVTISEIDTSKTGAATPWVLATKAKILRRNHDIKGAVSTYEQSLKAVHADTPNWKRDIVCGNNLSFRDFWPKETEDDFVGTVSFAMAQALWEDSRRDEAVETLKKLIASKASEATKVSLLINLGVFEWRQKKFNEAYNSFSQAEKLSKSTFIPPDKKAFIHANWAGAMLNQIEYDRKRWSASDLASIENHIAESMSAIEGTASHDQKAKFETLKNRMCLRLIQNRLRDAFEDAIETEKIVTKISGMDPDAVGNFYSLFSKLAMKLNDKALIMKAKNHAAYWYYRGNETEKAEAQLR